MRFAALDSYLSQSLFQHSFVTHCEFNFTNMKPGHLVPPFFCLFIPFFSHLLFVSESFFGHLAVHQNWCIFRAKACFFISEAKDKSKKNESLQTNTFITTSDLKLKKILKIWEDLKHHMRSCTVHDAQAVLLCCEPCWLLTSHCHGPLRTLIDKVSVVYINQWQRP